MMHTDIVITLAVIFYIVIWVAIIAAAIYLFILVVKALKKYISTKEVREEKVQIKRSLAEVLKENRLRCKMTQEFVSEAIGVSRQAVSKWENGSSDPSTSNLIALAELYGITPEELIRSVTRGQAEEKQEEQ